MLSQNRYREAFGDAERDASVFTSVCFSVFVCSYRAHVTAPHCHFCASSPRRRQLRDISTKPGVYTGDRMNTL